MRLYRAGDRSAGICEACGRRVATRMEYRDYRPEGWEATVPDVLVSACETCGQVVNIPHQSTPRINEFRKPNEDAKEAVEARVPRVALEVLDLVAASLGGDARLVRPTIVRHYLNEIVRDPAVAGLVASASAGQVASGKAECRLSIKVSPLRWAKAREAAEAAGIAGAGQLLRGVLGLVAADFDVETCPCDDAKPKAPKGSQARAAFLRALAMSI